VSGEIVGRHRVRENGYNEREEYLQITGMYSKTVMEGVYVNFGGERI